MPFPLRRADRIARNVPSAVLGCGWIMSLLIVVPLAPHARAADVVVLTASAFRPVLLDLAQAVLARTGNTMVISGDTAGGVSARVERGEEADLVIMPTVALDALVAKGKVVVDSVAPVSKSGIGVVVKRGAPLPDISSVEAFKRTMLATPSFAYIDPDIRGSSGVYLARLFDRLGISAAISRKAVLVPGGLAASRVDDGEAAMALQQISELRAVSDVLFVGPLPEEIQNYTVYAAGISISARRPGAGRALLAFLRGGAVAQTLVARGFELP
jgi:molybdate transport system substrate-binding protein